MKKKYFYLVMFCLTCNSMLATININNDLNRRTDIFQHLSAISADVLSMDAAGNLSFHTGWFNFSPDYGTRLIRNLINSSHNVDIGGGSESVTTLIDCQNSYLISNGSVTVPGLGSGSTIEIDFNPSSYLLVFNFSPILYPNTLGNESRSSTLSIRYIIAHELIHALHGVTGMRIPGTGGDFTNTGHVHVANTAWGFGDLGYYAVTEIIDMEEAVTVGFNLAHVGADYDYPGYSSFSTSDITENAIRAEQGGYLRGLYLSRAVLQIPLSEFYFSPFSWSLRGSRNVDGTIGSCNSPTPRLMQSSVIASNVDSKQKSELSLFVYPNPASSNLFFKGVPINNNIDKVEIYNASGQRFNVDLTGNSIDISRMSDGYYFLKIELDSGEIINKKFIKKN